MCTGMDKDSSSPMTATGICLLPSISPTRFHQSVMLLSSPDFNRDFAQKYCTSVLFRYWSDFYKPLDHSYGSLNPDGSWNGLIKMLLTNEVEMVDADMYLTTSRSEVIDYVFPILCFKTQMYIQSSDSMEMKWTRFMWPFSWTLWLSIILSILCISVTLFITKNVWNTIIIRSEFGNRFSSKFLIFDTFFYTYGVLCYQGQHVAPTYISGRIIVLFAYATAVIILMSYSASLISSIMTQKLKLPFTDFEGFLDDGSYTLGAQAGSAELDLFKKSPDRLLQAIYKKHMLAREPSLPHSNLKGLKRVCKDPKYSWMISPVNAMAYATKLDCKVEPIPNAYLTGCSSMAVQKKSPYTSIFRLTLQKMLDSGILQKLLNKHFPLEKSKAETEIRSVSINQVAPIFIFLIVSIIISCFILLIEQN